MRVSWTQGCGLLALSTAVLVLGTNGAYGQFSPYTSSAQPQQQAAAQPQWQGYAQPSYAQQQAGYAQQQTGFAQQQAQQPSYAQQQPAQQQPSYAQQQPGYAQQQALQTQPQQQAQPRYTAMAFQGSDSRQLVESLDPSKLPAQQTSVENYAAPAAVPSAVGYAAGCGTCDIGYNTFDSGGGYGYGRQGYGNQCGTLGAANCGSGRRWFGGVYGLLMERDNASRVPLAFVSSTANAPPYYPTDTEIALTTRNVDIDFQGGVEFRLGATLGGRRGGGYAGASCDSCGGGSCASSCGCGPTHAWEAVYWGIFEDDATSVVTDITADAFRTYGMMDFRGLEYSPTGLPADYRSVNVWFDNGPPTVDNSAPYDVEVRSFTTRSTFSAQNLELNLLRLPVACGGCGNSQSRYEMTTFVGGRYMRLDEDFLFRTDYQRMDTNALGFLAYNVEIDNDLYGVQMGCNGVYHLGCTGRFAVQCSSAVGVYGNHIEVSQRMDAPTGGVVRYANGTQANFNSQTDKDDVAIIAELRLGSSYQVNNNWRVYSGWRVLGLSGVALATDQIPTAFITPGQVGNIASSGSMILHGLQAGVEYNY